MRLLNLQSDQRFLVRSFCEELTAQVVNHGGCQRFQRLKSRTRNNLRTVSTIGNSRDMSLHQPRRSPAFDNVRFDELLGSRPIC